jgi:Family of unknown function (DUF5372)
MVSGGAEVTVTRHRDPVQGLRLQVLGRSRRRGRAELLVVLPDGSKRVIPAAWTDECPDGGGEAAALASIGDLLALCALVSAFSARPGAGAGQAARKSPCKEDDRAACAAQSAAGPGSGATPGSAGSASRPAGRRGDYPAHQADPKDGTGARDGGWR